MAQCSALVATCFDFLLTIVLARFAHMWYAYATLLGAIFGGIVNCCINYRWVFHAFGLKKKYIALRYLIVWMGSIAVKAIVAVAVAVLWNYQMQRYFVFKNQ